MAGPKKYFAAVLLLFALLGITIYAFRPRITFYWQYIREAGMFLKNPPENIEKLINTSGMPLTLPPGFSISIFAKNLGSPRVMAWDPAGNILVSIPAEGKVVALPDKNGDGVSDETLTIAEGLNRPHGLSVRCAEKCELYIAETDRVAVYEYEYDESAKIHLPVNGRKIIDLPSGGRHFTRTITFLPFPEDHRLLTSIGSSCDVCEETGDKRAKILISNADGSDLKDFATGLRNAVFMAIHPVTGRIWATEMGRDWLGDELPPDEINIIEEGRNYGWPICYGKNIHDTEFDKKVYIRDPCSEPSSSPSHIDIPAHSAPLGLAFFPEEGWPEKYRHDLLVAYHGSWNRSAPSGYKIVRYNLNEQGGYLGEEDFVRGWLTPEDVLGRPVDIIIQPGGTIYVSDDKAGVIYRIKYLGEETAARQLKDKTNLIRVTNLNPDQVISNPSNLEGTARGLWFFEASFPVRVLDEDGSEIGAGVAEALENWMTENFVPFKARVSFKQPMGRTGMVVFEKSNPSGLAEHADELRIPIRFQ